MLHSLVNRCWLFLFVAILTTVAHSKKTEREGDSVFRKSATQGSYVKDGTKIIYCPAGPPGLPGPPGAQGVPGRDGRDGRDMPSNGGQPSCPPPTPCPSSTPCPSPPPCAPVVCDRPSNAESETHNDKTPVLGTVKNPSWSCQELFAANPQLHSGAYWLKSPEYEPYQAHCEMKPVEPDRGGWTLVAKVDGQTNDFAGISPTWTNSDVINEDDGADLSKTRSMKNHGWGNIVSNALIVCFSGAHSHCATFTHNKEMTLAKLFKTQFAIETKEQYTFSKLMGKFGKNLDISGIKTEWCGINLGDLCSLAHPPSRYHGSHVCRVGCIGDSVGSERNCHPQDYALGIGVAVCHRNRNKRCTLQNDSSKSLHYENAGKRGSFPQTAFIYVK